MSRQVLMCIAMLVLGGVMSVLVMDSIRPAEAAFMTAGSEAPFAVAASNEDFVMIDARNGNTWVLQSKKGDTKPVWLPVKRLDTESQVQSWKLRKNAME